MYQLSLQLLNR